MKKFSSLERKVIRLAYALPRGSQQRAALREVLAIHFNSKEEWEKYKEKHPGADEEKHVFDFTDDKDKKDEDDDASGDDDSKDDDEPAEVGTPEERTKLDKAKEDAKKKWDAAWSDSKKTLKSLKNKLDLKGDEPDPTTFGEVAEAFTALMSAIIIPDQGGEQFLSSVTKRLDTKAGERKKVQEALAALKAVEAFALANPDQAEKMREDAGIDPISSLDQEAAEDLKKAFMSDKIEEVQDENIKEKMFDFFSDMDDDRVKLLKEFVSEDGTFRLDDMKSFLVGSFS